MPATGPVLGAASAIALALVLGAVALTVVRVVRGPHLADRAMAVDLLSILAIAFLGTFSVWVRQPVLVDVALALALVGFVATVAFARLIERRQPTHTRIDDA